MTRPNVPRRRIVIQIPARPFDRLFQIGSVAKVRRLFSSGFTDLLVPVKQLSFSQLQSSFAVHPNRVGILGAAFSFLEERQGGIKAIFYSQQSLINSL